MGERSRQAVVLAQDRAQVARDTRLRGAPRLARTLGKRQRAHRVGLLAGAALGLAGAARTASGAGRRRYRTIYLDQAQEQLAAAVDGDPKTAIEQPR